MSIDSSKRQLLAEQVLRLSQEGNLGVPLGCDYNAQRAPRWTDRLTGKIYLRFLPSLLQETGLGLAPQTVVLLDSIMVNMGPAAGSQFAINFTSGMVSTGHGYWHHPTAAMRSKTNAIAEWICKAENFGAIRHMLFDPGKEAVQTVAAAVEKNGPLVSRVRQIGLGFRLSGHLIRRLAFGDSPFEHYEYSCASYASLYDLLPMLGILRSQLYKAAKQLCKTHSDANSYAQDTFKHPIYWMKLPQQGDQMLMTRVLNYASESLATEAVFLSLCAAAIQGSEKAAVQTREGYILANALNALARAHAVKHCAQMLQLEGNRHLGFEIIASSHFDQAYVEAYAAISEKFSEVVSSPR